MALPYHLVKVCGSTVFAAQGSDIHSFTSGLEYVSTWKYPVQQRSEPSAPPVEAQESPAPEGPPAKRRKVANNDQEPTSNGHVAASSTDGRVKSKKAAPYDDPANERPFVQGLYATPDGRHLIAVTGSDKTIWVFEHDGSGNLKQLSQRAMPKRPCSLALTTDNKTILAADKFGDVYALPLLPSTTSSATPNPHAASLPPSRSATPSTPTAASAAPLQLQGSALTVHTKRNLKALQDQKRSLDRNAASQDQQAATPSFEHTLLLGHVSMLTAICVGTTTTAAGPGENISETRRREYIITADRDEHIRVSRGMPQAHVIECFCLGHEDFVSRLCVAPGGREALLISGGGDDDLFVWDWLHGRLVTRAGVLEHVQKVAGCEGASKVAVTRVFACAWLGRTGVFVVVERVPALFHYELLDDNTIQHRETIPLPGIALDVDALETPPGAQRLLVAVAGDVPTEDSRSSLIVLEQQETGWNQTEIKNLPPSGDINISTNELQKILYSTESLRKLSDFD